MPQAGSSREPAANARVRLADVARAAGVAPAVVSRVMNEDQTLRIRPETRARVIEAIASLQYAPHHGARALSTGRVGTLGLVLPMLSSPLNEEIMAGAQRSAWARGYSLLLADSALVPDLDAFRADMIENARVDGLVLQRNSLMSDEDVRSFLSRPGPSVVLNASVPLAADTVALDDAAGIEVATEHLLQLGHRRIAHLAGALATDTARRRRQAFVDALRRAGIDVPGAWIVEGGHDVESGRAGMRALLTAGELPTAIVAANVIAAIGALAHARDAGISVPGDLSIVAFHDTWVADHTAPPLTTVKMPMLALGAHAVDLLIDRIEGAGPGSVVVTDPPPALVVRGSTAAPAHG